MKTQLHIDTRCHVRFSAATEHTLQSLLLRDFPTEKAENLWQQLCRIYKSYLTDLPYRGFCPQTRVYAPDARHVQLGF